MNKSNQALPVVYIYVYIFLFVRLFYQDFDPERVGEAPEERPSPGAHESDMMFTEEQEKVLQEHKNSKNDDGSEDRIAKRKGMANLVYRWPMNIVPYKVTPNGGKKTLFTLAFVIKWVKETSCAPHDRTIKIPFCNPNVLFLYYFYTK